MERGKVRELVLAGVFAALTALSGFLQIPLGFLSITLQTMLAALSGMVLGPRWGAASQGAYVALGLVGLPIFTKGGGPGYVLQPSFGFLLGFLVTAWVAGALIGEEPGPWRCAWVAAVSILAGYGVGVPYMGLILNVYLGRGLTVWQVVWSGLVIYLPGEAVKIAATAAVAPALVRLRSRRA